MEHGPNRYDELPYTSWPIRISHPCHTATVARLFGLQAPDVRKCRVLELGCASGGNLIPMALSFPESEFVGLDYSNRQINDGHQQLAELRLSNIELRYANILDVDADWGKFDYIIAHGVFSWVPHEVQQKILRICRQHLTPRGLAYISYNTYPGWHLRGVAREMMRYHSASFASVDEQVQQARQLLDFLVKFSAGGHSDAFRTMLGDEADILRKHSDTYLYHEHLEEHNEPLYFYEFIDRAMASGLQYVGESEFTSMLATNLGDEAAEILKAASLLRQEQYMDFLRNRTFRATLLCHEEVPLSRNVNPGIMDQFSHSFDASMEIESGSVEGDERLVFKGGQDTLSASNRFSKAVLACLNDVWPRRQTFEQLLAAARERLGDEHTESLEQDRERLASDLMRLYSRGVLRAEVHPPEFATTVSDHPVAWPLARLQAEEEPVVANLRHERVKLDEMTRLLIPKLDGQHNHEALRSAIREGLRDGRLQAEKDGEPIPVDEISDESLDALLQVGLFGLARIGVLLR